MDELYRRRALWTYARTPSVLSSLPEQAITEILSHATLMTLKSGEPLIREGAPPSDVFLVRTGFLKVSRTEAGGKERVLVYFREGDLFGLAGLLMGERATPFGVHATTRSEVVKIPGPKLFEILGRSPHARASLEGLALEAERGARQANYAPPSPAAEKNKGTQLAMSAEILVEKGLATGTEVLVIDTTRCVNCESCVEACGRRHKYSRLQLRGLQVENYLFPTACRHCEDPVCLLCSVNGIVRLRTGEITIVEDNCIGCGACAERCPYGNITMHDMGAPEPGLLQRLAGFFGWKARKAALDQIHSNDDRRIAVKCDLCAGFPDYACVSACPVGAAFRIDPMKSLETQNLAFTHSLSRFA
jgi:Fe-S-cluster-containing hydrogenase component 2